MRKTLAVLAVVLTLGLAAGFDAEAKRLGGGRSSGMQRNAATAPAAPPNTAAGVPAQTAPVAGSAAAAAAPAAAAATAKRSWMGPLAGIAAGLGIAALASHFGFGEALANMLTIALLAMAAVALIGFIMRKRAAARGGSLAGAGAGAGANGRAGASLGTQQLAQRNAPADGGGSLIGSRVGGMAGVAASDGSVGTIPADFDRAAFERAARDQFTALQTANDARDLERLRDYLAPEMFDVVRGEIAERGDAAQKTEVFGLQSQVLDVAEQDGHYVVSVRFSGSVRTEPGAAPEDLDEVWHLTKPLAGVGGWIVAGIQQRG
jgi:predicted lipid-binding transport protein (Tim44 family)